MRSFKNFVQRYRLFVVSVSSFFLGALCVAAVANPAPWTGFSAHHFFAKAFESSKKSMQIEKTIEIESHDNIDEKETASEVVAEAIEKKTDEGKEASPVVNVEINTDNLIPGLNFINDAITTVAPTPAVRAVPFWENLESDKIFANLNLSEILRIDPEVSPKVSSALSDRILLDYQERVAPEFEVPELIFNQTKFWFRIYTEFDSNKKVIHDSLHPHIIFDVVDISETLAQPTRAQWLNVVKAQKLVSKRVTEIRLQLKKMARKKKEDMTTQELSWLSQFEGIQGNQRKIIMTSAESLRVQTGQKDFFENALYTSGRYLDGMESIFKNKGLPIELTRLPFVESSFVIGATSKVGAAGIWQFMPGVGRQFMRVTDRMDERRSPWKATEAAAKLLKENYTILHRKWGLALTAYNHGPGGVRKAMQRTGSKDIAKIVRTYRSKNFDFASANFYTCFLAAVHAQMYRDQLWPDRKSDEPLAYDSIHLKKDYRPKQLLSWTGLSDEQILLYNPELDLSFRRGYVIPKGYRLFLPSDVKASLQSDKVIASQSQPASPPSL